MLLFGIITFICGIVVGASICALTMNKLLEEKNNIYEKSIAKINNMWQNAANEHHLKWQSFCNEITDDWKQYCKELDEMWAIKAEQMVDDAILERDKVWKGEKIKPKKEKN